MFYLVWKQAYKLELPARRKIYNVFYVLLLKQKYRRKNRINKFSMPKFKMGNNKKYEIETIQDSAVNAKKTDKHLPRLYYLVI